MCTRCSGSSCSPPQQEGNTSHVPQMGSCQLDRFLQTKQSPLGRWSREKIFLFFFWLSLISEAARAGLVLQSDHVKSFATANTIDNLLAFWCNSVCVPLQTLSALQDPEDFLDAYFINCGKRTGGFVNNNIDVSFFFFFAPLDTSILIYWELMYCFWDCQFALLDPEEAVRNQGLPL